MTKWIPVTKRKPKRGQDVLAWCGWCITAVYKHHHPRKKMFPWTTEDGVNPIFHVTHWMPLPEGPEEKA